MVPMVSNRRLAVRPAGTAAPAPPDPVVHQFPAMVATEERVVPATQAVLPVTRVLTTLAMASAVSAMRALVTRVAVLETWASQATPTQATLWAVPIRVVRRGALPRAAIWVVRQAAPAVIRVLRRAVLPAAAIWVVRLAAPAVIRAARQGVLSTTEPWVRRLVEALQLEAPDCLPVEVVYLVAVEGRCLGSAVLVVGSPAQHPSRRPLPAWVAAVAEVGVAPHPAFRAACPACRATT